MPMTPDEFRGDLDRLDLPQGQAARLLAVEDRTVRRWLAGERIPFTVAVVIHEVGRKRSLTPARLAKLYDQWGY